MQEEKLQRFTRTSQELTDVCFVLTDFLMSLKTVTQCGDETSCLSNKLGELSLATFDEDGVCIAQSGSWALSP